MSMVFDDLRSDAYLSSLAKGSKSQADSSLGNCGAGSLSHGKRADLLITSASVIMWMGSNLGVLLLNKLLLSYWNFKQPVLLTFLHMISGVCFIWGLKLFKLLNIQRIQSAQQLTKVITLSLVFACAVLCANVSLKFLAVSMNQAIGAATPVFAAIFALLLQGEKETWVTYSTLGVVVGGVIVASGVEPSLNAFGAAICFLGAAFRGLRAVMQAMLLRPEEKLDSMSCLAYMVPFSSIMMLILCAIVEPTSIPLLLNLPFQEASLVSAILLNCLAAFASNYFNMVVTKRTSALTIQVLGQCKGVVSAVVSVLCFHNVVPVLGWFGYTMTVIGCFLYGRCKAQSRLLKHSHKNSIHELGIHEAASTRSTPREYVHTDDEVLTEANGRRTAPVFRVGAFDDVAATDMIHNMAPGNEFPHGRSKHRGEVMGGLKKVSTVGSLAGSVINSSPAKDPAVSSLEDAVDRSTSGTLQVLVAPHTVSVH